MLSSPEPSKSRKKDETPLLQKFASLELDLQNAKAQELTSDVDYELPPYLGIERRKTSLCLPSNKNVEELAFFKDAVFIYADMVGYTTLTPSVSHLELIQILDDIYTEFKTIAERYPDVSVVKTNGDCMILISSSEKVPLQKRACNMVDAALEMSDFISRRYSENSDISFRFGLDYGSVSKVRMFNGIDYIGDALNRTARMESSGIRYQVQISSDLHKLVQNNFSATLRPQVNVKSLGKIDTYIVISRTTKKKPSLSDEDQNNERFIRPRSRSRSSIDLHALSKNTELSLQALRKK